jgi:hypothetical protein
MRGGSMEKLAAILGYSSTEVTKRYAHLRPAAFTDEDRARMPLEIGQRPGRVLDMKKSLNRRKSAQ